MCARCFLKFVIYNIEFRANMYAKNDDRVDTKHFCSIDKCAINCAIDCFISILQVIFRWFINYEIPLEISQFTRFLMFDERNFVNLKMYAIILKTSQSNAFQHFSKCFIFMRYVYVYRTLVHTYACMHAWPLSVHCILRVYLCTFRLYKMINVFYWIEINNAPRYFDADI